MYFHVRLYICIHVHNCILSPCYSEFHLTFFEQVLSNYLFSLIRLCDDKESKQAVIRVVGIDAGNLKRSNIFSKEFPTLEYSKPKSPYDNRITARHSDTFGILCDEG